MTATPSRIAAVTTIAVALLAGGCAPPTSVASRGTGTGATAKPSVTASTPSSPVPSTLPIPAKVDGEFGRVSRAPHVTRSIGRSPMVAGQVYRLVAACMRGGADDRVVVDLRNAAAGADRAASVTTFSIACDAQQHDADFQVAVPTRPALSLAGTSADTVAYAYVVSTGRTSTCSCR